MRKDVKIGMFVGVAVSLAVAGVLLTKGGLGIENTEPVITPESLKTRGRLGDSAGSAVSYAPQEAAKTVEAAAPVQAAPAPITTKAPAITEERTPAPMQVKRFCIVQQGDTLSSIAKKYYGTSSGWKKIYEANRDVIENPNRPKIGTKLTIPD